MPIFGNTNNVLPKAQSDKTPHHPSNQHGVESPDFCIIHKYKSRKKRRNHYHPSLEEGGEYLHHHQHSSPPGKLSITIRKCEDKDVTVTETEGLSKFLLAILPGFTDLPRIPTNRIRESDSPKGQRWSITHYIHRTLILNWKTTLRLDFTHN